MRIKDNSKIMITGAAGFIGSHLVKKLLREGLKIKAFDLMDIHHCSNLTDVKDHRNFDYIAGDIRDKKFMENHFCTESAVIYHLASIVGVKYYMEDPLSLIDIAINGTRNILDHCLKNDTRILFSSTSEIYGRNKDIPWNEDADRVLGNPSVDRWSYSSSKALIEHMLFALHKTHGLKFSTVRFFNVYGPGQNPIYVVSQTLSKILKGEQPEVYDKGTQSRCFTYVDDVIEGIVSAATLDSALGHAFNIGSDKPTSIKELVNLCLKITGSTLVPLEIDTKQRYGKVYEDIEHRVPDVSKAKEYLDWVARTTLHDGLTITAQYMRYSKKNEKLLNEVEVLKHAANF